MRLVTLIKKVDAYKPNSFTNEQKTDWVNEIEGRVYTDALLISHYDFIPLAYRQRYVYLVPEAGLAAGRYYFVIDCYQNGLPQSNSYTFTLAAPLASGSTLTWDGERLLMTDSRNGEEQAIAVSEGAMGTLITLLDRSDELLVPPPHDKLYAKYLEAMIDFHNGEANRYANTAQLFNDDWEDFITYLCYTYAPANKLNFPRKG